MVTGGECGFAAVDVDGGDGGLPGGSAVEFVDGELNDTVGFLEAGLPGLVIFQRLHLCLADSLEELILGAGEGAGGEESVPGGGEDCDENAEEGDRYEGFEESEAGSGVGGCRSGKSKSHNSEVGFTISRVPADWEDQRFYRLPTL